MKLLTTVLFVSIALQTLAQENQEHAPAFKKFQIGINISPDISFRTLKTTDGSASASQEVERRDMVERKKIGYTAGVIMNFNISSMLAFETGIQYSNKGYQTKTTALIYEQPDANAPATMKSVYSFNYIDIPLKLNLAFGREKLKLFSGIGLTTNILTSEKQEIIFGYSNGETTRKKQNAQYDEHKKINISPLLSLGLDYQLNLRSNLRIEPIFRYGVLTVTDGPVSEHLWNAGLNVGYYFSFK